MQDFEYKRLGVFTYHILTSPDAIKQFLLKWLLPEWQTDHQQAPEEPWTIEWLARLPNMEFSLEVVKLYEIHPRTDLMEYKTLGYSFAESLEQRANEREESVLRGCSIEPLLVDRQRMELMDGYTRYILMRRYNQSVVYAYLGVETNHSN